MSSDGGQAPDPIRCRIPRRFWTIDNPYAGLLMLDYDFDGSIGFSLCAISHAYRNALDARLAKIGISRQQVSVLYCLMFLNDACQSRLARRLRVSTPTMSAVLKRMERAKLICRKQTLADRRRQEIQMLPKGEQLMNLGIETMNCTDAIATRHLNPQKAAKVISLLKLVARNLASSTDSSCDQC